MYQIHTAGSVLRLSDGAVLPRDQENVDWVEYQDWVTSGGKTIAAPVAVEETPRFYGNEKLDLFTRDEQLAIVTATMTDPVVKLVYDRLLGAAYWTYEDPETEQGLSLLQDKGLLTAERKAEIVAEMQPAV